MYVHEKGSGQRPGQGSSCIMTVGIDWGSGVVISTSRRTKVLLRLTSSVSAVSQSIIVCPSKSWPVRSLAMWNVPGRWNSRRWPAHGMWLVAGIPCSIALTAKCITLACKQESSPSWEICGDLDVYGISEHTSFFSYHLRTPKVAQMVFWLQHKQIGQSVYQDKKVGQLSRSSISFTFLLDSHRYSVKKDLNCSAPNCEYLPREVHQSFAQDPQNPLHLVNHNNSAKDGYTLAGMTDGRLGLVILTMLQQ